MVNEDEKCTRMVRKKTVKECPDKTAFLDTDDKITFAKVSEIAKKEGAYLIRKLGIGREPVAVFCRKKDDNTCIFPLSCVCGKTLCTDRCITSGQKRIEKILENLMPRAIVADRESLWTCQGNSRRIVKR